MLNRMMIMSRRSVVGLLLLLAFSWALCGGSSTIDVSAGPTDPGRAAFGPAVPRGQSTLGDLVWLDLNLNGRWGAAEPGIDGVVVQLYSDDGDAEFDPYGADALLQQMTTGDNPATLAVEHGWYDFSVEGNSKLYWVLLTASNFEPGGPLAGLVFTSAETKGPVPMLVFIYGVVEDYNEADFGYARTALRLVKTAGDAPDGQPLTLPAPGPVTYTYRVTNTGDTYLTNVIVTDDNGTPDLLSDDFPVCMLSEALAPGATSSCSHTTTILGDRTNVAVATGQPADAFGIELSGDPAYDSDDATVLIRTTSTTPTPTATPTSTATTPVQGTPTSTATPGPIYLPLIIGQQPTPTPTATPSQTATSEATGTPTLVGTPSPTPTASATPSRSPTVTATRGPTMTPTATLEPPIPGFIHPKAVAVAPNSHRVYATARDTDRLVVFDGASLAVIGYTAVGDEPWGVAVNAAADKVYVANFASGDLYVLDATTLALRTIIPVGPKPTFVKIDPVTNRVFVVTYGNSHVAIIDGITDTLETTVPSGGIAAWGLAVNPNANLLYVSNRDSGTVTTLDGNRGYQVVGGRTIQPCGPPGASPYGLEFNPLSNKLYIACSPFHNVNRAAVYRAGATGLTRLAFLSVGDGGDDGGGGVALNTATGNVFFTNSAADTVSVISGSSDLVVATLPTGSSPFGAGADPTTRQVYVVNRDSHDLSVFLDMFGIAAQ